MAFPDTLLTAQQRLLANAPYLAQSQQSVLMNLMQVFLAADADTNMMIAASAPNITYTTATGQALSNKASDYGKARNTGSSATAYVVFTVQAAGATTQTIPIGSIVGTGGDGITSPMVNFATTALATISSGDTDCGAPVPVTCTQPGALGNVAAGAIVNSSMTGISGIQVSNAATVGTVSNPSGAGVGGVDADTDAQLRAKIAAAVTPQYGAAALQAAAIAAGAYDCYVADPQLGSGFIYYYWCDVNGLVLTISGGSQTGSGSPDTTNYINGSTISGLAATVDAAIRAVLPVGVVPRIGNAGTAGSLPFSTQNITALSYTYSAPTALQSATIQPLIDAAIIAYVQSLVHNQIPTQFGMATAVQSALGNTLTNFVLGATTPAIGSAANTTIWRASGAVTFTRTRV